MAILHIHVKVIPCGIQKLHQIRLRIKKRKSVFRKIKVLNTKENKDNGLEGGNNSTKIDTRQKILSEAETQILVIYIIKRLISLENYRVELEFVIYNASNEGYKTLLDVHSVAQKSSANSVSKKWSNEKFKV